MTLDIDSCIRSLDRDMTGKIHSRFITLPDTPGSTMDKWKGGQAEQGPRMLPIFAICHTELFVPLFLPAGEKEEWARAF